MPVVPQMVPLHGMHRAEHHQAEPEHDQIGRAARQPQRVVKGAVHDAQSRQEEDKGGGQRQRIELLRGKDQRPQKPRGGQQQFANRVGRRRRRQIAPLDRVWPRIGLRAVYRAAHRLSAAGSDGSC
jgi:hypothetical protein